jgi:hypothetical protein
MAVEQPTPSVSISGQVFRELIGVCGAALAGYGAWLHYPPLGFMVGGGVLVALAVIGTLRGSG